MGARDNVRGFLNLLKDDDFAVFTKILRSYFPIYKYKYGIIIVLIGLASAATAATAWLVKDVVNNLFVEKQSALLAPIFFAIVAAFCLKGVSTYFQSQLTAGIGNDMVARTQMRMISHILRQQVSFFDRYSSDDLIMRVNQGSGAFGAILNRVILGGSRDAATVLALLFVMITQDATLTAICLVTVPLVFFAITRLLRRIKSLMQQEMQSVAELNKHVRETVQGAKVIKAYNLEPVIEDQTNRVIESIKVRSNALSALENAPVPIIDTLGGIGIGLTILYAGYRSVYGAYDLGTFSSFVTALLLALDPARRISQLRITLKTSLVAVSLVQSLLDDDQPEERAKTPRPETGSPAGVEMRKLASSPHSAITMENVGFHYTEGQPVLHDFAIEVRPGEMVALVGPSGAGKSTVFSLLLRFHRQNTGRILLDDQDVDDMSVAEVRDRIGYVGQSNFIFTGSIGDNLSLKRPGVERDKIAAACEIVGLHGFIAALPKGYDTPAGELGSLISGGQAQRLNIARAIIKDAPILLFDEVTSALDAENEELVRGYMHAQAGKKTILVIAHRLSTIRQADRIALIDGGRVRSIGTHPELLTNDRYYEKIAGLQLIA